MVNTEITWCWVLLVLSNWHVPALHVSRLYAYKQHGEHRAMVVIWIETFIFKRDVIIQLMPKNVKFQN